MVEPLPSLPPAPSERCRNGHGLMGYAQTPISIMKPPMPKVAPGLPADDREALREAFAWLRPASALRPASSSETPGNQEKDSAEASTIEGTSLHTTRNNVAAEAVDMKPLESVSTLIEGLRDRSHLVRCRADKALHDLGESDVSNLVVLIQNGSPQEQSLAAEALGKLGLAALAHAHVLKDSLQSEHLNVRRAAATALEALGPAVPKSWQSPRWRGVSSRSKNWWSSSHGLQKRQVEAWDSPRPTTGDRKYREPGGRHVATCRYPAQRCSCRRIV